MASKIFQFLFRHGFTVVFTAWRHADGPEGCGRKNYIFSSKCVWHTWYHFLFSFKETNKTLQNSPKLSNPTEQNLARFAYLNILVQIKIDL